MTEFFNSFFGFFKSVFLLLDNIKFNMFGYSVSYLSIIASFLVIGFFVTMFWKGAKA